MLAGKFFSIYLERRVSPAAAGNSAPVGVVHRTLLGGAPLKGPTWLPPPELLPPKARLLSLFPLASLCKIGCYALAAFLLVLKRKTASVLFFNIHLDLMSQ